MDNPVPIVISLGAPRLEDLALNVLYNKVLCKATPSTVELLRGYMENQSKTTRDKCIQKMNDLMAKTASKIDNSRQLDITNVGAFLDSILDICFVNKLEINIPYEGFESYSKLFSIIAHRCPELKLLSITFYSLTDVKGSSFNYIRSRLEDSDLSQVDHRLNCLEMLDLHHSPDRMHFDCFKRTVRSPFEKELPTSILSIVGEYCPILASLTVKGFYIRDRDMLALITGASVCILFPVNDDRWTRFCSIKSLLLVPTELMTSLCFTLQSLRFTDRSMLCFCQPNISDSTAAFALKHLPELRTLQSFSATIGAIQLLYSDRGDDGGRKTEIQKSFEEYCLHLTGVKRDPLRRPPLSGFLGLSEVTEPLQNPIAVADSLRAIGYMCPHLDRFEFDDKVLNPSHDSSLVRHYQGCYYYPQRVAQEELDCLLSAWPKLDRISLMNFKSSFSAPTIKLLMGVLSSSLTVLVLKNCSQINLTHLSVCTQLQQLHISDSRFYSETSLDAETFLPSLKQIKSNICLRDFSHLFERKSLLIDVEFNCCHIGTKAYNDPAMEWSQVPKLWPRLQSLRVGKATGLTMDIISNFVSEMPEIYLIEVPESITLEQTSDHIRKITQGGRERKQLPVIRHFQKSSERCLYQPSGKQLPFKSFTWARGRV